VDRLKEGIARLGADLRTMARLRWQLARLEWGAAVGQLRRLALVLALAGVAILASFSVFVVAAAELLEGWLGGLRAGWLGVCGAVLLVVGIAAAWLARRQFRRHFTGMQETLEELREDALWIEEWMNKKDKG
jgi:hypothetical protein